jgi:hypothetical protein
MPRWTGRTMLVLAATGALLLSACAPIEPWVKPYERENLANPIMAIDPDPISSSYMDHVLDVREGASGATGGSGGGCGCT